MGFEDLTFNPAGGATGKVPMKSVPSLNVGKKIEDITRYSSKRSYSAYYPVKVLPSLSIESDKDVPVVFPAGTIVSVMSIKDAAAYTVDDNVSGIRQNGEIYTTLLADGTKVKRGINSVYNASVSGLMVPANGNATEAYVYSDAMGTAGILDAAGNAVTASTAAYSNVANKPFGYVASQVYGDLRGRWLNYEYGDTAYSIEKDGVITVPYIIVTGSTNDAAGVTARLAALKAATANSTAQHQFYSGMGYNAAAVAPMTEIGAPIRPWNRGKITYWVSGTDLEAQRCGNVIGTRNRGTTGLDEIIESFPGSSVAGTDTAGLSARMFDFLLNAYKVLYPTGNTMDKAAIKELLAPAGVTVGGVTYQFGQVDIEFDFFK